MDFQEYVQHHYGFFETLLLQITLRCPLECEHCNVNSGPTTRVALTELVIEQTIRSFAETKDAKMVFITGGEPFAEYGLLRTALKTSRDLELATYVITSAFWAKSKDSAVKLLDRLPVIDLLSISVDQWHSKFLPLDNMLAATEAALEKGTKVNIAITLQGPDDPFRERVDRAVSGYGGRVSIYECMVAPVGRSRWNGNRTRPGTIPMGYCPKIGAPTVTSDGSIIACCNSHETNVISQTKLVPVHALRLGHVEDTTLQAARERLELDPLLRALRFLGPSWVWQAGVKYGVISDEEARSLLSTGSPDICGVCTKLVRDGDRAQRLRAVLSRPEVAAQMRVVEQVGRGR